MTEDNLKADYFDIYDSCEEINKLIQPEIIDKKEIVYLWKNSKIALCFDWGVDYWDRLALDIEFIVNQVKNSVYTDTADLKFLELLYSIVGDKINLINESSVNRIIKRIENILFYLKNRKSHLILPEKITYEDFLLKSSIINVQPISAMTRAVTFPEKRQINLNPILSFKAKPYKTNCEYFYINIPSRKGTEWISYNSIKKAIDFNNYFLSGVEYDDFVLPKDEINALLYLYRIDKEERSNYYLESKNTRIENRSNNTLSHFPSTTSSSPKTVNYLASALKAFIQIQYGAEVAENIRKYLEDPNSEVSQDFSGIGLKAPNGKALQKHMRDVVIEIIPEIEKSEVNTLE
ncbi:hypothetical protein [Arsenophonus nasoniae]|uniref:Uncharacterized protein n=1 Tax=Arsenophonus nasoniae TaxID=638 RepID=A0A4V1BXV4_9GAMM|nr:hypothetical protein [Arsenophonus nasoniae]QBY47003.1 hypothetical protein ArsFIN_56140 [Arsenophonus nasoniae]WGM09193.1 hypothetical protein QE258_28020 [Arsenophonus nasoniae]